MAETFSASIEAWVRETETRTLEVFRISAATTADVMSRPQSEGGRLPKVTGNLQRSLAVSTIGPPPVLWGKREFKDNLKGIDAVIGSAQLGQTIWLGFQAIYARNAELDHGFVRLAATNWQQIVDASIADMKSRMGD